jgi:hypothetical protein
MDKRIILEVEHELKRFQERLKALKETNDFKTDSVQFSVTGMKETAALKRSSMDLSRTLAKLRK